MVIDFKKGWLFFYIPFILICNWINLSRLKLLKTVVSINQNLYFQQIYTTQKTEVRLFASFQNSVKNAMLFRPTNQLNVKETKGVVH